MVGFSGAGKSTPFHLVERFVECDRGTLSVLSRDVTRWLLPELRSRLGYVDQSFTLLEGTSRENLLLDVPSRDSAHYRELGETQQWDPTEQTGTAPAALPV
ncbi:ATP-binding cassette domain-containing protein [Streptomyces sp. SCSIO 75703]|uniref:ATP-binding cassette domain-containing protein n=1 Tax=unclassified Streptomyces TaxID=2593676 RepID=UPI0006B675A1|nr:ATP-binding cassette domain-containing protein [Streptomyces sp. TP-A0875]